MKTRVLLVDDHSMFREGLRSMLDREPSIEVVGEAVNGVQAVRETKHLKPDVVVMDIVMPEMTGIEATKAISAESKDTKILVLTTYADRRYMKEVFSVGASGYVQKTSAFDELIVAISTIASGRSYISPQLSELMLESADKESSKPHENLTARESEVLKLIAESHTNKEIAQKLFISIKTVEAHRRNIMTKLDLRSVVDLAKYAVRKGIVNL